MFIYPRGKTSPDTSAARLCAKLRENLPACLYELVWLVRPCPCLHGLVVGLAVSTELLRQRPQCRRPGAASHVTTEVIDGSQELHPRGQVATRILRWRRRCTYMTSRDVYCAHLSIYVPIIVVDMRHRAPLLLPRMFVAPYLFDFASMPF